jgi:nitrilase
VLFNKEATTTKAVKLIHETSMNNADLVLFPEAFIPSYPRGFSFSTVAGHRKTSGRDLWQRYFDNSVSIPGPTIDILGEAADSADLTLAIGVVEKDGGTLYCTTVYFGSDGSLLGKHRKLKPTGSERLIWGEGDGSTLTVIETSFGIIGGLICWENYMPLARTAMYEKGVEIYLAPTADSRDTWMSTLRHIACEGRCFVLGCNQYITKDMYPSDLPSVSELKDQPNVMCRGGSAIIGPLGEVIAGPLYNKEGILYAELRMEEVIRSKFDFDVVGHYARPDVFHFRVNENPLKALGESDGNIRS